MSGNLKPHLTQAFFVFAIGGIYFGWRWLKANLQDLPLIESILSILNDTLADVMTVVSGLFLKLFGFSSSISHRFLTVDTFTKVEVTDPCVGVGLYIMFVAFVGLFPGKQKPKLWYIPVGILIILAGNTARVVGMVFTQLYIPGSFELMHLVILRGAVFLILVLLCIFWVNYSIGPARSVESE